jgi:hypothetical protein
MLPCLVIHRNLSVLLHEHTYSVRFHMSFTYCIFCEVCELWPRSSLQEIAERNVGPLLYINAKGANRIKYGSPHSVRGNKAFQLGEYLLVSIT